MAVVILGDSYNDRVDSTSSILVPQEDLQLTSADTIPSTSSLIFSSPPVSFDSTRLESSSTIVFTGGGGGGVTDHGFLTGRADDDHVQYALLVGRGGDTLHIDDIDEYTADAGVTVESVVLEDGGITLGTGATVDTIETVVTDDDTHLSTSGAIVDYVATQVATVNQFTELTDTPNSYAGEGGKFLRVNATPDAVEFVSLTADLIGAGALDIGANAFTVNSVEIVGSDGEVNKAAVEDSGNWDTAYGWGDHSSAGYVDYTGTPVNNQIAVFTDINTLEGHTGLIYDSGTGALGVDIINESTADAGVTVDGVLIKDYNIESTGAGANIGLVVRQKGNADLIFGRSTGISKINASSVYFTTDNVYVGYLADCGIKGVTGNAGHNQGATIEIRGGSGYAVGDNDGGDIKIYGGSPNDAGTRGNIYFGDGSTNAYLPAKGAETDVVYYNTTSGKLSYGSSTNWDTAYTHSQIVTGNPHVIGYADIADFNTGVSTYETSHADVLVDGDFTSNGLMKRTAAGTYSIVTDNSATWNAAQPGHANLTSLANLSYVSGSFVKMTGANTFSLDTNTYLTGNQSITLSGDVSGTGATAITTTIGANKVTLAMMAQMATASFLGRTTGGVGNVEVLTATQATAMLNLFSTSSTTKGLVPGSNSVGATYFLNASGNWAVPPGSGMVYPGAGVAVSTGSAWTTSLTATNVVMTSRVNTYGDFAQTFKDNIIRINNPADTYYYTLTAGAIAANRILNLPVITATDTLATLGLAQTFTAKKTFSSSSLLLRNPGNTYSYTFVGSAITGNRNITLPLLTGNDTMVTAAFTQTLTNKNFNLANNTLTGTASAFNTACSDNTFVFVGDGYVNTTPTPATDQVAVFTDADTIEGNAALTFDSGTGVLTAHTIVPAADSTYALGTSTVRWLAVYSDNVYIPDNSKIYAGNDNDFSFYHTGGHSYLDSILDGGEIRIKATDLGSNSRTMVVIDPDDSVELYYAGTKKVETATGGFLVSGDVIFTESADHSSTPGAGYGYLWVRSDTPNVLVFTDDAGTDTVLGAGSGFVDINGTPADNQIAVFTDADTIEGDADFTFDSGTDTLTVGNIAVGDDGWVYWGTSNELGIRNTGGTNFITSTEHGSPLLIQGEDTGGTLRYLILADPDNSVGLYYNGTQKFVTTTVGATLSGILSVTGDIALTERADHASTPAAGQGYLWVKSSDPSTIIFTDDAGTDFTLQNASSLNSGSGITIDGGNNIDLGGALDAAASITGAGDYLFEIKSTSGVGSNSRRIQMDTDEGIYLEFYEDNDYTGDFSYFTIGGANPVAIIGAGETGTNDLMYISIDANESHIVVADEVNTKGMVYAADYSGNFTDRSLVDKAYVDSVAGISGYFIVPGCTFTGQNAYEADIEYSVTAGSVQVLTDDVDLVATVTLPNGVTVTAVVVYGDAAATDETYELRRVKISDATNSQMATANIGTIDSTISDAVVDNTTYAYFIVTSTLDTDDTIYGAKVTYVP